jgi:hypothetical protein
MSREYYTLAVYEDGHWSPQFGDYSRAVVKQEREDWHDSQGYPYAHLTIISTGPLQADIDAGIRALNKMEQL